MAKSAKYELSLIFIDYYNTLEYKIQNVNYDYKIRQQRHVQIEFDNDGNLVYSAVL
jgi:hypothetical protein